MTGIKETPAECPLNENELFIYKELSNGEIAKTIGEKMCLSRSSIANYISSGKNKLGAKSSPHAVRILIQNRWI